MASRNIEKNENLDDEDTILTATITFDVTLDKNGQVINTSEGEIISERIDTNIGGTDFSNHQFGHNQLSMFRDYHNLPSVANNDNQNFDLNNTINNTIQADSLASMVEYSQRRENKSILQDSLDEIGHGNETGQEEDDDEPSTTTESLIERSKKYVDNDAGIIVLRRDEEEQNNFNINLEFDLKGRNSGKEEQSHSSSRNRDFNIGLDFDLKKKQQQESEKDFNINIDFDLNDRQNTQKNKDFNIDLDFDLNNEKQKKQDKDFNINIEFDLENRQEKRRPHDFNIDMNYDAGVGRRAGEASVGFDVMVTDNGDEEILMEETLRYVEIEGDDDELRNLNGKSEGDPTLEEYLRSLESNLSKTNEDSGLKEGVYSGSVGHRFVNNSDY